MKELASVIEYYAVKSGIDLENKFIQNGEKKVS